MPRSENMKPIHILVSEGDRERIKVFAHKRGLAISDYIRGLIRTDMQAEGEDIELKVEHGGDRRSDDD